jgi:competence CoiA-like predicted nuclease
MVYALDHNGSRVEAAPGRMGACPICAEAVTPKCGRIRAWHWAHARSHDCDTWSEGETEWHRSWKLLASPANVEVRFGEHRADIVGKDGLVIELQNSPISPEEIAAREAFYSHMVWLLNGSAFHDRFRVQVEGDHCRFVWAKARLSWLYARKPRFVHGFSIGQFVTGPNPITRKPEAQWRPIGGSDQILQILTIRRGRQIEGTGRIISTERFCQKLLV